MAQNKEKDETPADLSPEEAVKTWDEVPLGYSREEAIAEATRSLAFDLTKSAKRCPLDVDVASSYSATMRCASWAVTEWFR